MSVYEEIINGTYKKRNQTVYESIVNGTYKKRSQTSENYSNTNTAKTRFNTITNNKKSEPILSANGNTIGQRRNVDAREVAKAMNEDLPQLVTNITDPSSWINKTLSKDNRSHTIEEKANDNINSFDNIKRAAVAKEQLKENASIKEEPSINDILSTVENKQKLNILNHKSIDKNGNDISDRYLTIEQKAKKARQVLPSAVKNFGIGAAGVLPSIQNYGNSIGKLAYQGLVNKGIVDYNADNIVYKREGNLENKSTERAQEIQRNIDNVLSYDNVGKKLVELAPSIGENTVSMAISQVNPTLGTASFMLSAAGNYLDDAKQRGLTDEQAVGYATIMGIAEGASESLVSAQMLSTATKALTGTGLSKATLKSLGMDITENFFQEAIMEPIQEATAQAFGGEKAANWENIGQRMLESGLDGVWSALLLEGMAVGITSSTSIIEKVNKGITPSLQEYVAAFQDIKNSNLINIKDVVEGAVKGQVQQIEKQIANNQQNQANNTLNIQGQQIIQQENKTAQNQTSNKLSNILNNKNLPMQKYQYEKSDNVKINKLRQDANKYFNNKEQAHNFVNMLEKIVADKDIDIRLDSNLKTADGRIANGSYSNGAITINPNSTRAGEFIAIHELTHAIGTDQMKNMIDTYRKSNVEFNSAVENILQNYKSTEINEEALADISGQLFGTQEFINNIAQNNPNIFQKLYSEIKYLWHQFRGYKNQNQFVDDLYYKWTQAYNNSKLNKSSSFSIQTNSDGSQYVQVDTDQNIFEGKSIKEQTKIAQEYILNNFREKGLLKDYNTINVTRKTANEYTHPKNGIYNTTYSSKMKASTELDNLLEISKFIKSESDDGRHIFAKNGWDYYETVFKVGDKTYSGWLNIANGENGKLLYDITNIKERASNYSVKTVSVANSSINNSIPSSNKDVNTTRYSIQESENNSQLSERAEKELHRYTHMDKEELNKAFSDAVENKENMLEEYNRLSQEYKEFQKTEEFMRALKNEDYDSEIWSKAGKYADKLRYYNENYEKYKAQQEAINSLLMEKKNNVRSSNQIVKEAEKHFGITNNFKETAYIDTNGNQIDFSGKHEGGISGSRSLDHRQINEIDIDMQSFIDMGNIRIMPEGNGINLSIEPNSKQYAKLEEYIDSIDGEIYIDIDKTRTTYDSIEYKKGTSTSKIIRDLQYYFKNGEFPRQSEFAQFRYSISKKAPTWQAYLENNFKSNGTRTNLKDIKLPMKKDIKQQYEIDTFSNTKKYFDNNLKMPTSEYFENKKLQDLLTDEDYDVLDKMYEKEGKTEILTEKKKASILEKYINDKFTMQDSLDTLAQKVINKGHYVDKLAEKTNNPELKFIYDRNLNSFAEGQYVIGVAQTNNKGEQIGKSINEIWEPIENSNLTKEFSEYLLHKHNIDRSQRSKYVFGKEIGPTESTAIALDLENKHPEFKRWAKEIKNFNHNNLLNMKEAGLITEDTIKYIETMYPNYITIARDNENSTYTGKNDKTGTLAPLKKATGGNADIQPLKDTMAQQTIRIKQLINQNKLGQELAKSLKDAKVIEKNSETTYAPSMLMELETLVDTDSKGNKYYTYFEDGVLQKLKINDNLYESLKPTEISKLEKTLPLKLVQKVTSIHRSLLTSSNPIFVVTNFFKDFQDGAFNSKYSSKFVKNYGKALNEIYTRGKYYESYMANGGMNNSYFDYNEGIKKKPNKFVEKIRNANEIVEQLPRLAEFISTLEDGKSLNEALYNAAEITTNFKRGGDLTKAINRNGVNFLNASIQGLDKQWRNFSGQNGAKGYANLLLKATIMGIVPAILNHMLLGDDEDYQDLPESTKDLYYLFKYNDGKFIRIPKGRVLSIFGAAARRTLETVEGQEDSWNGFGETVINQVAPNNPLEDNIIAPIIQVKNNKTWYGSDLVSSRLQEELPKNQYDETTDNFSKWLGDKLNVSPKKINYLIDQYSGGIGDVILPMITPQAKQNVFVDKFTTDSVLKNKNVSKFYDTLERQTQIANDSFATDEDEAVLKYLNSVSKEMSSLYKEKRKVQMSNISNKEKTTKVREVQEQINKLAEEGLNNYKNNSQAENYSKVGNEEYYKNSDGEWTTLTESEKEKNKEIPIEIYSDYKQKLYSKKNEKIDKGEMTKKQDLKDADKIQILLDSNYSDKEKSLLYENYIKSEKDTQYNVMKVAGISITEYLKYKTQTFESDKKDDGTIGGKTVNKSKQKKVTEYLNSMKITGNQRLLLYALQGYTTTSSQKTKLANYVNGLSLSNEEKLKVYDKFSGFTVYKNGKIEW